MPEQLNKKANHLLKQVGLYRTKSRLATMTVLLGAQKPLTQETIAQQLKNRFNKATIYRCLDAFRKNGLVHRAYIDKRAQHFELAANCGKVKCHPHFTCENCGKTLCLTDISASLVKGLPTGFILHRQQVRLEGLCPDCADRI